MNSTPENLMMTAKGFAISATRLRHSGEAPVHDLAILHLCCTSIELSLKAWIRWRGGSNKDIRQIGHNLGRAYDEAVQLGLVDQSGSVGEAIRRLSPVYSSHFTRYFPEQQGFTALTPDSLVRLAQAVSSAVETDIWPSDEKPAPANRSGPDSGTFRLDAWGR